MISPTTQRRLEELKEKYHNAAEARMWGAYLSELTKEELMAVCCYLAAERQAVNEEFNRRLDLLV